MLLLRYFKNMRRTRPRASPARRRTRLRNIPLAMTMKNDGHGSMR